MLVKLILPDSTASLITGATLHRLVCVQSSVAPAVDLLWRVGGVDDDGLLGLVVNNEVGIVVASSNPCVCQILIGKLL